MEGCLNHTCAEYRTQHRNATLKKLELERELGAIRLKYDLLFNQVVTQGAAAAARVSETGEEAFRLPNGELMTAERFMERTRILTQTRSSLEKSEGRLNTAMDDIARVEKDKEALVNECKRFESLLTRFEKPRRYDVYTSDDHRETIEENSRLVDQVDDLNRRLGEAREEIQILKSRNGGSSLNRDPRLASSFLTSDGVVPPACPMGGCLNYDSVQGALQGFQTHMHSAHRCKSCKCFVAAPKNQHEAQCSADPAVPKRSRGVP